MNPEADEAFKSGYIAVSSVATSSSEFSPKRSESALSPAIQIIAVKKPSQVKPNAPYPKRKVGETLEATEGYTTPPDFHGKSFFSLEWTLPANDSNTHANQLKYEVYRALDRSIISADHHNWQLKQGHYAEGVHNTAGQEVLNAISYVSGNSVSVKKQLGVQDDQSIFLAIDPPIDKTHAEQLQGGAFEFTHESETIRYPIIGLVKRNDSYLIRTRNRKKIVTTQNPSPDFYPFPGMGDSIKLFCPPDYSEIIGDSDTRSRADQSRLLRQLADLPGNEKAFDLVTKSPIDKNTFTDILPGKGRNRFYYRVRGGDIIGNRTPLSDTSVAIYLVDTTPPATPLILKAMGGDRKATIIWQRDTDSRVTKYIVYREIISISDNNDLAEISEVNPDLLGVHKYVLSSEPQLDEKLLAYNPITNQLGSIDLDIGILLPESIRVNSNNVYPKFTGVYKKNDDGETDYGFNYLVENSTEILDRVVINVNPGIEEGTEVVLVVTDGNKIEPLARNFTGNGNLVVTNNSIDLNFPFNILQILGVYKSSDFNFHAEPITNQNPECNLFTSNSAFDHSIKLISNLSPNIDNQSPIILLAVNLSKDGSREIIMIQNKIGTSLPLKANDLTLQLDLEFIPTDLLGIYLADEYVTKVAATEQKTLNYLTKKSDFINKQLINLNPLLKSGEAVVVELTDNNGNALAPIKFNKMQYVYSESISRNMSQEQVFRYRIIAIKRVRNNNREDNYIEITSRQSAPVHIHSI